MNEQEAIEFIKNKIKIDVRFCTDEDLEKTKTALHIAIKALEKQVVKTPIEDGYFDEPMVCPNCGESITKVNTNLLFQYCFCCGQAINVIGRNIK